MKYIIFTTVFLVLYIVLCQFAANYALLMSLFIAGNGLIILIVYKTLTEKYTTKKVFNDWYEDNPKKNK
jgi:hypothetical protein